MTDHPTLAAPRPGLAAIVLAAGASSRMGSFKPLLDLGGISVLARVVELMRSCGADPVLVITGNRARELEAAVRGLGATPVFNPEHAQGMFSSLCAGLAALPPECEAFFLLPVDIPLVRSHTLGRLLAARAQGAGPVLLPNFRGEPGHPPLIDARLAPAIMAWEGPGGLRGFWEADPELTLKVPVADRFILRDLDTPQQYEALLAELPGRAAPNQAECLALLRDLAGANDELVAHSRAVGLVALALTRALNAAGGSLDERLVLAGGLLHDVAKGAPGHAAAGEARLRDMGYGAVAPLAGGHIDLPREPGAALDEIALVNLADKLVRGSRLVNLEERFAAKLNRPRLDPGVRRAIEQRREAARRLAREVERAASQSLGDILHGLDLSGSHASE
ncbi:MAG: NTP transferase domain-containing protein [Desulfarculaceae bacterium]|nr:NTP transferase domain-containing protein [Desulfarculaceae bacterium]MCF8071594.1 NTP transferase domain-containing protein [Desulfarculaceae bacterium]MCF8102409.1 NTP transferase domain-containing protein [Desulfarculaceae bacterium]MCF8114873.1 NTP transferase domain-containing protein [Desulfarculaceae bacterium]